jgi:hypothetical protein
MWVGRGLSLYWTVMVVPQQMQQGLMVCPVPSVRVPQVSGLVQVNHQQPGEEGYLHSTQTQSLNMMWCRCHHIRTETGLTCNKQALWMLTCREHQCMVYLIWWVSLPLLCWFL